jgi:hypothetical protein
MALCNSRDVTFSVPGLLSFSPSLLLSAGSEITHMGMTKKKTRTTIWTKAIAQDYGRVLREMSRLRGLMRELSGAFNLRGDGDGDGGGGGGGGGI